MIIYKMYKVQKPCCELMSSSLLSCNAVTFFNRVINISSSNTDSKPNKKTHLRLFFIKDRPFI